MELGFWPTGLCDERDWALWRGRRLNAARPGMSWPIVSLWRGRRLNAPGRAGPGWLSRPTFRPTGPGLIFTLDCDRARVQADRARDELSPGWWWWMDEKWIDEEMGTKWWRMDEWRSAWEEIGYLMSMNVWMKNGWRNAREWDNEGGWMKKGKEEVDLLPRHVKKWGIAGSHSGVF
jgi:hypothetical protein